MTAPNPLSRAARPRRVAIVADMTVAPASRGVVQHLLDGLRPHVELLVLAGAPGGAAGAADAVIEAHGLAAARHRAALTRFAPEIAAADELLLISTDAWGPIGSFDELFARAAASDADAWGPFDRQAVSPDPWRGHGERPAHLRTTWIGVRRPVLDSATWRRHWEGLGALRGALDEAIRHEGALTQSLERAGLRVEALWPSRAVGALDAASDAPDALLVQGCPLALREVALRPHLEQDAGAVCGRAVLDRIQASGFPMRAFWSDVNASAQPRTVHANLATIDVLADRPAPARSALRVVVCAHVFYPEMVDEILDRVQVLPASARLVVTTAGARQRDAVEEAIRARGRAVAPGADEVRVLPSNRGRDISAFLIGCRDVLLDEAVDVVVKLHSKRSPATGWARGRAFKEHLFDNLLHDAGHADAALRRFEERPALGMLIPPMVHIGEPTLGRAWFANRAPAERLAAALGIDVPFDDASPVAAFGSMFIARPAALRRLVDADLAWEDFPDEGGYRDGGLAHVLERLFAYAALGDGWEVRAVTTPHRAAVSLASLEFKAQEALRHVPGMTLARQIGWIRRLARTAGGPIEAKDGLRRTIAASDRLDRVTSDVLDELRTARARGAARWRRVRGR